VRSSRLFVLLGVAGLSLLAAFLAVSHFRGARQHEAIAANAEEIFRSPRSFVAGDPDGDVSVVAFFDYNCPYCRNGAPDLDRLLAADGKVRLVLKELPVLGRDSEEVARIAQAAIAQGNYLELHRRLFAERGRATKDTALRIAAELGFDPAKLKADMHSRAVEDAIAANRRLAARLKIRGVPFYLVGDRPVDQADEDLYAQLAAGVADVRQNGCATAC
jgi:protein-disulfide isomerase